MKMRKYLTRGLVIISLMCLQSAVKAQNADVPFTSPYFAVITQDPLRDQLPLKYTGADVKIAGVIADVTITQVYMNTGSRALEAAYVFPASTRAAVYALSMSYGGNTNHAVVQKRGEARATYNHALQAGKTAALLEEFRPNIFRMNVANVLPGDSIVVKLSYTELLIPEQGVYEFRYPTVVGPRYVSGNAELIQLAANPAQPLAPAVNTAYTHEGEPPLYRFGMNVHIAAGMPLRSITSPSHGIISTGSGDGTADVVLTEAESAGGNRDFVLHYSLRGHKIQTGLLAWEGEDPDENFFLLMAEPPAPGQQLTSPPREYIFVMDVSGSMDGYPIEISKKLVRSLIRKLSEKDKFNILFFAGGSEVLFDKPKHATPVNKLRANLILSETEPSGGTELLPAMQQALGFPVSEGYAKSIVVISDGYITAEPEVFQLIRENIGQANVFAFGIGTSMNQYLMEGLAAEGKGLPFIVAEESEAKKKANDFEQYISHPLLTRIQLHAEGVEISGAEPALIPDVLADRPVIVSGKYKKSGAGSISLTGVGGDGPYRSTFHLDSSSVSPEHSALRYLWARERIRLAGDYRLHTTDTATIGLVTRLGLKYNLLTPYTSFVAVSKEVRISEPAKQEPVLQPLPLPKNIPDEAVGDLSEMEVTLPTVDISSHFRTNDITFSGTCSFQQSNLNACAMRSIAIYPCVFQTSFNGYFTHLHGAALFTGIAAGDALRALPTRALSHVSQFSTYKPSHYGLSPSGGIVDAGLYVPNLRKAEFDLESSNLGEWKSGLAAHYRINPLVSSSLYVNGNYNIRETETNAIADKKEFTALNVWKLSGWKFHPDHDASSLTHVGVYARHSGSWWNRSGNILLSADPNSASLKQYALFADHLTMMSDSSSIALKANGNFFRKDADFVSSEQLYSGVQGAGGVSAAWIKKLRKWELEPGIQYLITSINQLWGDQAFDRFESVPVLSGRAAFFPNHHSIFKAQMNIARHNLAGWVSTPSVSAGWRFSNNTVLYADWSSGFQYANPFADYASWLLMPLTAVMDSALLPERSHTLALSARTLVAGFDLHGYAGFRWYPNRVVADMDQEAYHLIIRNEKHYQSWFSSLRFTKALTKRISLNGSWNVNLNTAEYGGENRQELLQPQHKANARLVLNSRTNENRGWNLLLEVSRISRQRIPSGDSALASGDEVFAPGYFVMNAILRRHFFAGSLYVSVDNIANYRISTITGAAMFPWYEDGAHYGPVAGRRIIFGINIRI